MKKLPRGLRNNNPGNIRKSHNRWKGKIDGSDPAFETFVDMAHGYRALMVNLRTYMQRDGLNTIEKIISKWAPPCENNTRGYIARVSKATGIPADKELPPTRNILTALAAAISEVENGVPAVWKEIEAGWLIM